MWYLIGVMVIIIIICCVKISRLESREVVRERQYSDLYHDYEDLKIELEDLKFLTVGDDDREIIKCPNCGQKQMSDRIICISCEKEIAGN